MRILLTNDDGVFSPGLAAMARALRRLGEVHIAAPATEQSGVGPAITFLLPLAVKRVFRDREFWAYAVEGTPVDCVKIGVGELLEERPDLVVSGINNGLNAGINIFYSGTVAAALEAAWQGIPSVAVSTQFTDVSETDKVEKAAEVAVEIIARILQRPAKQGTLYNVNIPFAALASDSDRKVAVVPMDRAAYWDKFDRRLDPMNRRYYWLSGRPGKVENRTGETDLSALSRGEITVTPLSVDMTDAATVEEMNREAFGLPEDFSLPETIESESFGVQMFRWVERPGKRPDAAR